MGNIRYQVGSGETLSGIARRHRVAVDVLARLNGISNVHRIRAGQFLEIPANSLRPSAPTPSPTSTARSMSSAAPADTPGAQGAKKLPFDGSTQMRKIGRVSNADGVNLHLTPDPKGVVEKRLPFNMRVFVDRELPGDWYFVTLEDGRFGYVYTKCVLLDPPEPDALLHRIKPGETALEIVRQHYKGSAISWGQDERYYVNLLVEANCGDKLCGIYKASAAADWSETQTRANYFIWVPSVEFAKRLKGKVKSGSISYELWQGAKRAAAVVADVLLGTAAFVAGLLHGALESLWDFVTGIVDLLQLLWQLLVSAIKRELHPALKQLWDVVSAEFEKILARAEKLNLEERQLLDFLEMAVISKPWKKPPKVPLSTKELIEQMDNWAQIIRKRGYPFLFYSLAQFKQFQTRLKRLLEKYGIPEGRMVVQGSALRSRNAKDIDIAIFVTDEVFEAFVARCEAGILGRTKRRSTGLKIAEEARQNASEGYISKFHFDRAPGVPDVSFEKELWQVMEDLFQKEVDISVMKSSSKLDLYPFMDM